AWGWTRCGSSSPRCTSGNTLGTFAATACAGQRHDGAEDRTGRNHRANWGPHRLITVPRVAVLRRSRHGRRVLSCRVDQAEGRCLSSGSVTAKGCLVGLIAAKGRLVELITTRVPSGNCSRAAGRTFPLDCSRRLSLVRFRRTCSGGFSPPASRICPESSVTAGRPLARALLRGTQAPSRGAACG